MSTGLRSGELAEAAGVNRQTLRYYERRGLLSEPERSPGGHRLYPTQTLTVLRMIKTAQRLGFTLAEASGLHLQVEQRNYAWGSVSAVAEFYHPLAASTVSRGTRRPNTVATSSRPKAARPPSIPYL